MIGIYNSSISRSVFEILRNDPTYDVIRGGGVKSSGFFGSGSVST